MDKCILKLLQKGGLEKGRLLLAIRVCSLMAVIQSYIRLERGKSCREGWVYKKALFWFAGCGEAAFDSHYLRY